MSQDEYTSNTRGARRYRFDEEARRKREQMKRSKRADAWPSTTTIVIVFAATLVLTGLLL
jgi:hypothetical protein